MSSGTATVLTSSVWAARTNGPTPRRDTRTAISTTAATEGSRRLASPAIRAANPRRVSQEDTGGALRRFIRVGGAQQAVAGRLGDATTRGRSAAARHDGRG